MYFLKETSVIDSKIQRDIFSPFPIAGVGEKLAGAPATDFLGTSRRMPHCNLLPWETCQFGISIGRIRDGTCIGGTAALSTKDFPETPQRMKTALLWFCK